MKRILQAAFSILTRRERLRLIRLLIVQSLVAITDIGSLGFLLALIHSYTSSKSEAPFGSYFRQLASVHTLAAPALVLLLFALKNTVAYQTAKSQFYFIYNVATRLTADRLRSYLDGGYEAFTSVNTAAHTARISYQPMEYATFILGGIQQLASELLLTGLALALVLLYQPALFLLLLCVLLPPLLAVVRYSKRRLGKARSDVKTHSERATQDLQESLAGYIESNVYQSKDFFIGRYLRSHAGLSGTLARLQISQALPQRFMELFAVGGLLLLIALAQYSMQLLEPVTIGVFIAAAYKIIPGITRITNTLGQMRMYAYTLAPGESPVQEARPPEAPPQISSISMEDVRFSFGPERPKLSMSLKLEAGDMAGISAGSGRGKTTMLHLLLGFLEPQSGEIRINGHPAGSAARQAYWPQIAYVRQQSFFIHDTLLRNIILHGGEPDGTRLATALRLSGLDTFIAGEPGGLERIVTDQGRNLSGGQRQRLAFARAIYKDCPVLILDEPFSELDAPAEASLLKDLRALAASGRMILLVTHNAASLQFCNKTIGMHD